MLVPASSPCDEASISIKCLEDTQHQQIYLWVIKTVEIQRKTQEFTVLQIHTFKQPFTWGEKGQSNGYLDTSVVCDPDSPHQGSVKWLQSLGGSVGWGTAMLGERWLQGRRQSHRGVHVWSHRDNQLPKWSVSSSRSNSDPCQACWVPDLLPL